jgi:hypothetical protein
MSARRVRPLQLDPSVGVLVEPNLLSCSSFSGRQMRIRECSKNLQKGIDTCWPFWESAATHGIHNNKTMRTKTILLATALSAVGAATSMAQVFSVNAVGYVNKVIPANGFALISNPLKAATNTVNALFNPVPVGFAVYIYDQTKGFTVGSYDDLAGAFVPDTVGNATLLPGQGVFVKNPTSSDVTVTFVGEVMQGTLTTPLVPGLQIVSSQVPQAGTVADLGLPSTAATGASAGDTVYQFITNDPTPANNQKYYVSTYDDLSDAFIPALKSIDVGDAIFLKRIAAGNWTRTFNVNSP